ncbi:MAG: oxidoreductase, partial [Anaerolineales bacterium]|nr:oxidoreductase [Anaerolineales bacterium]
AEELMDRFAESFARINPKFKRDWVRKVWLFKADYAQPIPQVGHSQQIPAIETPLTGLYFASMSQVYPWDRGTNFAVEIGRRAARLMME